MDIYVFRNIYEYTHGYVTTINKQGKHIFEKSQRGERGVGESYNLKKRKNAQN